MPRNREARQRQESDRFVHHEYLHSAARRARREVRTHRYQWALRRLFNEARLERMKPAVEQ